MWLLAIVIGSWLAIAAMLLLFWYVLERIGGPPSVVRGNWLRAAGTTLCWPLLLVLIVWLMLGNLFRGNAD